MEIRIARIVKSPAGTDGVCNGKGLGTGNDWYQEVQRKSRTIGDIGQPLSAMGGWNEYDVGSGEMSWN